MIDAGRGDAVVQIRMEYQQAIEATCRAAVERASGRRVVSFASVTKLSPAYVVEIFRFGPRKQPALSGPDDDRAQHPDAARRRGRGDFA